MEIRGVARGVTVIDDFAHHPTAIATTLHGARARYPGRRLWALFEPRSISSARKEFEDEYIDAFHEADRVIIGPIFHRDRYESRYGLENVGRIIHEVGTTRMGNDARTSVVNANCQAHDVKNVFVADGGPFVSNAHKNCTWTILALAMRTSEHIARQRNQGTL